MSRHVGSPTGCWACGRPTTTTAPTRRNNVAQTARTIISSSTCAVCSQVNQSGETSRLRSMCYLWQDLMLQTGASRGRRFARKPAQSGTKTARCSARALTRSNGCGMSMTNTVPRGGSLSACARESWRFCSSSWNGPANLIAIVYPGLGMSGGASEEVHIPLA